MQFELNSSPSSDHFLTKIEQFSAPKSRLNFYLENLIVYNRFIYILDGKIMPKNFSHTFHIASNWYMDTGMRDLDFAFFKANST